MSNQISTQRKGIIFILPQTDDPNRTQFQDFTLKMTGGVFNQVFDFDRLIDCSIDKLHEDGFGDYLPLLKYSFDIQQTNDIRSFINQINQTKESKNIRILLSDMITNSTDSIQINGITHVAFLILTDGMTDKPKTAQTHPNPPLFYQYVGSVDEAVIAAYSVSLDSIMCHAIGMCDFSVMYNEKVGISREKVNFLKSNFLWDNVRDWISNEIVITEIGKLRKELKDNTPYVSLFTPLIPLICPANSDNANEVGNIYATLWEKFLLWYVQIHRRYLRIGSNSDRWDIFNALSTVRFYSGQIDVEEFASKTRETLQKKGQNDGKEHQVFLVVMRHIPNKMKALKKIAPLFGKDPNTLRQGNWAVVTSESIRHYVGDDNIIVHNMFISTIGGDDDVEAI